MNAVCRRGLPSNTATRFHARPRPSASDAGRGALVLAHPHGKPSQEEPGGRACSRTPSCKTKPRRARKTCLCSEEPLPQDTLIHTTTGSHAQPSPPCSDVGRGALVLAHPLGKSSQGEPKDVPLLTWLSNKIIQIKYKHATTQVKCKRSRDYTHVADRL